MNIDACNPRVVDSTNWLDLAKYKGLDTRRGVFILSNFFYQVKFIGRADDGSLIKEISDAIKNGKSIGATKIKVLYTDTEIHAISLERKLIKRYHPINNLK